MAGMMMLKKSYQKLQNDGVVAFLQAALRHCAEHSLHTVKHVANTRKRQQYKTMLKLVTPKERFEEIYKNNCWASKESLSGIGSELNYTKNLRIQLPKLINDYNINSIVDAPCGDFNWMKEVLPKVAVNYKGFDIVSSVIEKNISLYGDHEATFKVADICEDQLPDCDLLIVRDCLFHLSFHDINRFLKNINRTNYRYLLTTTHTIKQNQEFSNRDIPTGDFRLIDLFEKPFAFSPDTSLMDIDDFTEGYIPRKMLLFEKSSVPKNLLH